MQQEIRPTLVLNLDYTGTKGTRLNILDAPNRTATGILFPAVQAFYWEDSLADSAPTRVRCGCASGLQGGISIGGRYTFSKSIDNASTIGSGSRWWRKAQAAPDFGHYRGAESFDLAAERGLSSFDQRHVFTADYLWELALWT